MKKIFVSMIWAAADFNLPVVGSNYLSVPTMIRDNDAALAKMASTASNRPTGNITYNSTACQFEKYTGAADYLLDQKIIGTYSSNTLTLKTNNTSGLTISTAQAVAIPTSLAVGTTTLTAGVVSGKVGVGTTNPLYTFDVNGNSILAHAPSSAGAGIVEVRDEGSSNLLSLQKRGSAAAGNMGSGTGAGEIVNIGGNLAIQSYSSGTSLLFGTANTERMRIASDGIVTMSAYGAGTATFSAAGVISSVSDERLKDIKAPFKTGLEAVCKINPVLYSWKDSAHMENEKTKGTVYPGFIAQNIREALGKEAVSVNPEGYLSIQDRAIMAAMVNAIKELSIQVDKQQARIEQLEKALAALERRVEK